MAEDVNRSDHPPPHAHGADRGIKPFPEGVGYTDNGFLPNNHGNKAESSWREVETKVGLLENSSKDHSLKMNGQALASTEPSVCVHREGGSRTPPPLPQHLLALESTGQIEMASLSIVWKHSQHPQSWKQT